MPCSIEVFLDHEEPARGEVGMLSESEQWWRDHYHEIDSKGYELRPRYHPGWQPSWKMSGKDFSLVEDGQVTLLPSTMDATRRQDGKCVMLKKVPVGEERQELEIARLVSSPELSRQPRNHCVPLLETLELPTVPDQKLMVMPYLRPFNNPRFQTFGEFVAFFTQICDGIRFMHERNIAHRDCTANNIMFDPSGMYPEGFHPTKINRSRDFKGRAKEYTRTQRSTRYYLIGFSLSCQYSSRDVLDEPLHGDDKSAPEHRHGRPCNPFHSDVYYLGNLVREHFMKKYNGFNFMKELVDAMTDGDPEKRPVIEEVIVRFSRIRNSLSGSKLRFPITSRGDPSVVTVFLYARQTIRTVKCILYRTAAIPSGVGTDKPLPASRVQRRFSARKGLF
ncbi:kinase-like domain-containing protein [Lactifluus subvellereus]|nr:kinase-like domain-containing protein [Lactifluus subvellereus]